MNDFNVILNAVKSCDLKRVVFLCENGSDESPNEQNPNETRSKLLLAAAHYGGLRIAAYLIERGADPRFADDDGETALHMAALGGHLPIASFLIDRGADINARTHASGLHGLTPLSLAAKLFLDDEETETQREMHLEMIKLLLDRGADINAQDDDGQTALHLAASELDNVKRLQNLLHTHNSEESASEIAPEPRRDDAELLPLRSAAVELASLLIERDAVLDFRDDHGFTPLIRAAQVNSFEIAELLIDCGADIKAVDDTGHTAFDYARSNHNQALAKRLNPFPFPLSLLSRV